MSTTATVPSTAATPERHEGIIKWYSQAKGYGFIVADDLPLDVFVHHTAIEGVDSLLEGDRVCFDLAESSKGPAASRVALG